MNFNLWCKHFPSDNTLSLAQKLATLNLFYLINPHRLGCNTSKLKLVITTIHCRKLSQ